MEKSIQNFKETNLRLLLSPQEQEVWDNQIRNYHYLSLRTFLWKTTKICFGT